MKSVGRDVTDSTERERTDRGARPGRRGSRAKSLLAMARMKSAPLNGIIRMAGCWITATPEQTTYVKAVEDFGDACFADRGLEYSKSGRPDRSRASPVRASGMIEAHHEFWRAREAKKIRSPPMSKTGADAVNGDAARLRHGANLPASNQVHPTGGVPDRRARIGQ